MLLPWVLLFLSRQHLKIKTDPLACCLGLDDVVKEAWSTNIIWRLKCYESGLKTYVLT